MVEWLKQHWDNLAALLFIAITTSTVVALKEGTKGPAIVVSHATAFLLGIAAYPFLGKWGYDGPEWIFPLAIVCGVGGPVALSLLMSLRDRIEQRKKRIADGLLDRVVPEPKE